MHMILFFLRDFIWCVIFFAHPGFRIVPQIFARIQASPSVQLHLVYHSMDESEILNDARLYDELPVDDASAADSDSGDFVHLSTLCFGRGVEAQVLLFGEA